eukprot:604541-Alexandrium_andersonii.AAC.1
MSGWWRRREWRPALHPCCRRSDASRIPKEPKDRADCVRAGEAKLRGRARGVNPRWLGRERAT